ncbi:transporter substrate-binding domain-containing protein [Terasakiella sp. A23]|uniref:substrate-binding periplasmic protein n=1 Tax=Terasakiella sp. FCG-A23 TaxID=3080561 RepID=UPI0029544F9A|nr:transporter substrate-binding domain-containing protein [Terasakiella sp. A23]MDV7337978.1 transporter substrate-binding domain-containing protein [Terasakiella sp. A23]
MRARTFVFLCCFLVLLNVSAAQAVTTVKVLAYPFPPFMNDDGKTGITPDILRLLNEEQSTYQFELMVVRPQDRYDPILSAKADMMFFEMEQWNWKDKVDRVDFSKLLMKGGEVYIAKRKPEQLRFDFNQIESRKILGFEGYHYEFAGLNADQDWLKSKYNISFATSHYDMLRSIKADEAEIAIATLSFLKQYFHENPQELLTYVISQEFAQVYNLRALVRKDGPLDLTKLESLLQDIKKKGQLQDMLQSYGILRQWQF